MSEFEGLHLVLAKRTLECKRALRCGSSSFQVQLVLKVTKDWVLQEQFTRRLTDHERSEANLELSRFSGLKSQFRGSDFDILVSNGELRLIDRDSLVSGVLKYYSLRYALTDRAEQINGLDLFAVYYSDVYLIINVFLGLFNLESAGKFVDASSHSHEV